MDKKNEKLNVEVFDYSTIPKFMQEHGRFCLWKLVMKPEKTKPDKIPYRIDGKRADATNPRHYSSFDETVEAFSKGGCSSHQIHNVQVEEILLRELHRITAYAREHEREFIELVTKQSEKDLNRQLRDSHKELEQTKSRIAKLDTIVQRLYEDNLDGKISDERFARMSATYDVEQKQLEQREIELQEFIDKSKEQTLNVDSFLKVVRKYTDITELTAEIIRSFVERIDV